MNIKMQNGSEIETVGSLKGEEIHSVVIDEAAQLTHDDALLLARMKLAEESIYTRKAPELAEAHPGPRNRHERRAVNKRSQKAREAMARKP